MPGITVSDTSCLILFSKIGELELLRQLFGKIHITESVSEEFNQPIPDWIEIVHLETEIHKGLSSYLDLGEATSIALAAEFEESLLIIDEVKGRRIAKEMGISVTGSMGVLIAAKSNGYLKIVRPIIDKIEKTNFRISKELIDRVLEKANES